MTVNLPTGRGHYPNHQPFPGVSPTIVRFDDKVRYFGYIIKSELYSFTCSLFLHLVSQASASVKDNVAISIQVLHSLNRTPLISHRRRIVAAPPDVLKEIVTTLE